MSDHRIFVHKGFQYRRELRRCQDAGHVGAQRIECDITQVQQPGKTDHDIETKGEHDVQQGEVHDPHPGVTKVHGNERENHNRDADQDPVCIGLARIAFDAKIISHEYPLYARSATRSPMMPDGRNVRTIISTTNAKIS